MQGSTAAQAGSKRSALGVGASIKVLVGSGDRIGKLLLPVLVVGVALNVWRPALFGVGGPSDALRTLSLIVLVPGVVNWAWSVFLILTRVPRHELITGGPYALVKHPLYTGVAFLVLPWAGFLLDTWLGALFGIVLYVASRLYSPEEERALSQTFGAEWDTYAEKVLLPWL